MNSKQYCDFLSYVREIQPKSKDFCLNRNYWFLMILAKFYQKFLPNAKFGPVRPKELCVFGVCVCVCFPLLLLLLLFFLLIAWSKFLLIFPIYITDFRLKNTTFSASDRAHRSPSDTPYAMCASVQLTLTLHQIHPPPPHCRRRVYSRAALCSFGVLAVVNFLVDELSNSLSL